MLGELSEVERVELEQNLLNSSELRRELERVEKTQEELLMKLAMAPSPSVKERVMRGVQPEGKVVAINTTSVWQYATAASIVVALLASYLAYHYHDKWQETSFTLTNLIAQNKQIAEDYNVVNEKLDKIQDDFSIIENTAFTKIVMKGTANAPDALASVYWNPTTKEVYLSIQNLKELTQTNQFQLWAIVDGKPVDAGVFDSQGTGLMRMKSISGAVAFAVTIEPRGGKESPSLETMQAMGALPKG